MSITKLIQEISEYPDYQGFDHICYMKPLVELLNKVIEQRDHWASLVIQFKDIQTNIEADNIELNKIINKLCKY